MTKTAASQKRRKPQLPKSADGDYRSPLQQVQKQMDGIKKWANASSRETVVSDEEFLNMCLWFYHPKYCMPEQLLSLDGSQVIPLPLGLIVQQKQVWLAWERMVFDPSEFPETHLQQVRVFGKSKRSEMAFWGKYEYRSWAFDCTASLCAWQAMDIDRSIAEFGCDSAQVWESLYWFTRFYAAWLRIGDYPQHHTGQFREAQATRNWKKLLWAHYQNMKRERPTWPNSSFVLDFFDKNPELAARLGSQKTTGHFERWLAMHRNLFDLFDLIFLMWTPHHRADIMKYRLVQLPRKDTSHVASEHDKLT